MERAEGLRSAALEDKQQRDARVALLQAGLLQQMARSALLQISALHSLSSSRSGRHLENPFLPAVFMNSLGFMKDAALGECTDETQ